MAADMYRGLWSVMVAMIVTFVISSVWQARARSRLNGLVYGATTMPKEETGPILQE